MKNLCLNMIVRNESARIERCLSSVLGQVSSWVIVDTGSTDGTPEIIREFFKKHDVPGHMVHVPFVDFSQARNAALDAAWASPYRFDYLLLMDADMELKVEDPEWRDFLIGRAYSVSQRAGTMSYENVRLLNENIAYARYKGATHEYLDIPSDGLLSPAIWFEDHADGANRKDKFMRDIRLLHEDLKVDPVNPRTWFYLAQSHRDSGNAYSAGHAYRMRVELGGWDEERWDAQRNLANCLKVQDDEGGFVYEMLRAYQMRPQRLETLYDLAKHFRETGQNELSVLFSEAGMGRPMPKERLFLDDYAYKGGLAEEFSISGFYVPAKRRAAFEVCNRLALDKGGYPSTRALARANLFHYLQPLAEHARTFKAAQIPFAPPDGYAPMNPSVTLHGGDIFTTVRCVNYTITPEGRYAIRGDDDTVNDNNPIRTRNFLLRLDEKLAPVVQSEIIAPSFCDYPLVRGWEDMRLYSLIGGLRVSATVREANVEGWCEQHRGSILALSNSKVAYERCMLRSRQHEKNWMPTPTGDFVYRLGHLVNDRGVTVTVTEPSFDAGDMRGGSQLIVFRGGHLALVHEACEMGGQRVYSHRFVFFDHEYVPLQVSLPFVFHDKQIEFAAGLCWHPDMCRLVISYGVRDKEAWMATVDAHEIAEMVGMV